jgi:hypothetical protein
MALYHVYSQTVSDGTATSVVRPSDWNSAHGQIVTLAGNTTGQSVVSGTNIVFQGGSNVTLSGITGTGAATIVISGATGGTQSQQPMYFSAGSTSTSANTLQFGDTNGVSFAVSAGSVVGSVFTGYVNTSQSSGFAGAGYTSTTQGGSTVGVTQNSGGLSVAWPPFITTASGGGGAFSASGGSSSFNTLTFSNQANGVTFSNSAGQLALSHSLQQLSNTSAITASAINTSQSSLFQQTSATSAITASAINTSQSSRFAGIGYSSTTQAGSTVGVTQNTSGLSMAWPPFITTFVNDLTSGRAGIGFTSTTTAGTAITAALSTNGLSMAVPAYITTFVNDLTSGRAGIGFTSTTTTGTVITAALSTNGLSMAVPNFITTYVNDLTSGRAGTGSTTAGTNVSLTLGVNTDGVALSANVADIDYNAWNLVGNTAGTTGSTITTQGPLYFSGGSNITLSGNSNTIVISAAAGGGTTNQTGPNIAASNGTITSGTVLFSNNNGVTFGLNGSTMTASIIQNSTNDGWAPYADLEVVAGQHGAGTLYFEPEHSPYYFQDRVGIPIAYSNASNSSGTLTLSYLVGFYTQNVSTLSLASSTSISTALTFSGTVGNYSLYSGMRLLTIPWSLTVSEQELYIGQLSRTTTGGGNASISQMLVSNINSNFVGLFGVSHNTTQQFTQGQGVYSVTTSGLPSSVAFSQIRGSDSLALRAPAIRFINGTV